MKPLILAILIIASHHVSKGDPLTGAIDLSVVLFALGIEISAIRRAAVVMRSSTTIT